MMMPAISWECGIGIGVMAFFAEYVDSTLGMGYGTTLTPLLMLLFGFEPLQIVPAILLSELITGFLAGFTHHAMGNVDLKPRTIRIGRVIRALRERPVAENLRQGIPLHLRVCLVIAACSIVGTVASVLLALKLPKFYVELYIGLLVLAIGVVIVATMGKTYAFSWKKVTALGLIASFNKGISGGGYGPVVTGGQLLAGVEGKSAVGITSLAEGLTCVVGVVAYLLLKGNIDWRLAPYLVAGAVLSVPLSALSVKHVSSSALRVAIGVLTMGLGVFTLAKVLL
jgi:uncharacterized membrane protein YfcA